MPGRRDDSTGGKGGEEERLKCGAGMVMVLSNMEVDMEANWKAVQSSGNMVFSLFLSDMEEKTMQKQVLVFVVLAFMVAISTAVFAKPNYDNIAEEVREGVVTINDLMVDKNRVKALSAIEEVIAMVDEKGGEAQADLHKNLGRMKYYLNKYNWVRARRVLIGIMEDLELEYQPTYQ